MTEKYKVTQEFMDALNKWGDAKGVNQNNGNVKAFLSFDDWEDFPVEVADWQVAGNSAEINRRLIAIIRWFNHEDVFEVEKPHKFMVRSKDTDSSFEYRYLTILHSGKLAMPVYDWIGEMAVKKFDDYNSAKKWVIEGYEVVEIDGDGNEVTK